MACNQQSGPCFTPDPEHYPVPTDRDGRHGYRRIPQSAKAKKRRPALIEQHQTHAWDAVTRWRKDVSVLNFDLECPEQQPQAQGQT